MIMVTAIAFLWSSMANPAIEGRSMQEIRSVVANNLNTAQCPRPRSSDLKGPAESGCINSESAVALLFIGCYIAAWQ